MEIVMVVTVNAIGESMNLKQHVDFDAQMLVTASSEVVTWF